MGFQLRAMPEKCAVVRCVDEVDLLVDRKVRNDLVVLVVGVCKVCMKGKNDTSSSHQAQERRAMGDQERGEEGLLI